MAAPVLSSASSAAPQPTTLSEDRAAQRLAVWAKELRGAVEARQGGYAATLLEDCPLRIGRVNAAASPTTAASPSSPVVAATNGGGTNGDAAIVRFPVLSQQLLLDIVNGHALSELAFFECDAAQTASPARRLQLLLCGFAAFQEFHVAPRSQPPVGWDTAILVTLIQRIRRCALAPGALADGADGDGEGSAGGSGADNADVIGTMVRTWRKVFITLKGLDPEYPNNQSRRRGALAVLNGLLSILFTHHNLHQARIIIKSVVDEEEQARIAGDRNAGVLEPCGHMGAEVVRFQYYRGRMALYDRDAVNAFAAFREACVRLPPTARCVHAGVRDNKRRVLFYWAIAGLACGLQPPTEALLGDPLTSEIIIALSKAMDRGSDAAFDAAVASYEHTLLLRGVHALLLSVVRPLCLLSRLRRLHAAVARTPNGDPSRLPLRALLAAEVAIHASHKANWEFQRSRPDRAARASKSHRAPAIERILKGCPSLPPHYSDDLEALERTRASGAIDPLDELGLRVAQLIASGRVKGYVALEARTIVLSKKDPFPTPPHGTPA